MRDYHLYAMRPVGVRGPVKIGISGSPEDRLMSLALWSPTELELVFRVRGTHKTERAIHAVLKEFRRHNEWFDWSPQLQDLIDFTLAGGDPEDWLPDEIPAHFDIAARRERGRRGWKRRRANAVNDSQQAVSA